MMKRLFVFLFALIALLVLFTISKRFLVNVALAKRPATSPTTNASHPPPIRSISVCRPDNPGTLQQGSCAPGTFDTHQIVLGPGGVSVNASGLGVGPVPDEHSSVFAPGTLGANQDYLFFVASGVGGHAHIGVSVLSGGSGPDQNGQWTLRFPKADGYGWYGDSVGFGPVFNPSTKGDICPPAPHGLTEKQDQTFDMHYAASGSIVKDPTGAPGSTLMVYEGTNACIGNAGGSIFGDNDDYISLGIATSLDFGRTWPTYRDTHTFDFVPLPDVNQTQAPNAPMGALVPKVCLGNDCCREGNCITKPPKGYGRYPVVTPTTSLDTLMKAGVPLTQKYGEQEISGFVDDISSNATAYLYVNSGDVRVARAELNGESARLTFEKWDGQAFASPGLGGYETSVLPAGTFKDCGAATQNQFGSSISYVEETQQYLLTFVCISTGDPQLGPNQSGANRGGAWFWSTSYDLSDQTQWSQPQEIEGSWSEFDDAPGPSPSPTASPSPSPSPCGDYKGYYPTFMSLGKSAGHLSLDGHVFYLWGCQGGGTPGGRQFSSRAFTITTTDTTPRVTTASVAGPLGLNGWYTGPTTVNFDKMPKLKELLAGVTMTGPNEPLVSHY